MNTKNVCIIDQFLPDHLMYTHLESELIKSDIQLTICDTANIDTSLYDLILLTDPIKTHNFKTQDKVLGMRTLNRKERLDIAHGVGASCIAKWAAPKNKDEYFDLIKSWEANYLVLKYDGYSQKKSVYLVSTEDQRLVFPDNFDPTKDIVMECLLGDSFTYKVDVMAGNILNAYVREGLSIFDPGFPKLFSTARQFSLPEYVAIQLRAISQELLNYGVGYASIDLMKHYGKFKIIEININGIRRDLSWSSCYRQYAVSYPNAILHTVNLLPSIPVFSQLTFRHKPVVG